MRAWPAGMNNSPQVNLAHSNDILTSDQPRACYVFFHNNEQDRAATVLAYIECINTYVT